MSAFGFFRWIRAGLLLITVFGPSASASDMITLKERALPARADECKLCHVPKSNRYIKPKHLPQMEHQGYSVVHGKKEISCNACHDQNHSNFLRSDEHFPASWKDSSGVCQRCHAIVYGNWRSGIHGKRSGSWNGLKIQNHCIDCHAPHSVSFPPTPLRPPPIRPVLGVEKKEVK